MSTQIQTTSPKTQLTIRDRLEGQEFKAAVAKALPKHLTPDRFIRIACTAMTKTPKLLQCDQASFFGALLTLSQLGLEPDGRRAHLIPFGDQVQLIIDYKGLVELIMRSGMVSNLHADVVCQNDIFGYDIGQIKMHKINFMEPRGEVYAVYCIARFKDGSEKCDVMTVDEVEAIRARSRAGKSGPWVTDWNEMAKKTVFRRLAKWLPLSPEFRDAIDADEDSPIDIVQTFEMPQAKTKPNLGKAEEPKAIESTEEKNITPLPVDEKPKDAPKPAKAKVEKEVPKVEEQKAESDDGDVGPQTQTAGGRKFPVTPELDAKLKEMGVSDENFDKWVKNSREEAWTKDPASSAAKLLTDERALKKLRTIYGKE